MFLQLIAWPQGELTATWSVHGLCKLSFGTICNADGTTPSTADGCSDRPYDQAAVRALAASMAEYFAGGELDFPLAHFDWTGTPAFHRQVLERCAKIPRGEIMTYGQLAAACGSPAASRAVGQAMARNRWPLVVPCHRVIGSSGQLTGYSGIGGTATKLWLLEMEGARLPKRGRTLCGSATAPLAFEE